MLVTVIGRTGFVGAHQAPAIVWMGHRVCPLVREESTPDRALGGFGVADVRDTAAPHAALLTSPRRASNRWPERRSR